MTVVAFADKDTLVTNGTTASTVYTAPHPVGDANYMEMTFNAYRLFAAGGNPTIEYDLQGSNDGQNWFDITAIGASVTAEGLSTGEGDVTCAFVRFKFELSADAGSSSDITGTTFDLHANFTRK